eukprot:TRINITY_DN10153_c1_g2_i2.p1 TRINITY_DN10153_c1_g2~~TRINITY_DN10153_c1_g2_i2.p1  ORF type:complete len:313 (-),score=57.13 TRINITY_DN10153_c1_g2_i2:100-1005(-)
MAIFGQKDKEFATLDRAIIALFRALMGDFDVDKMQESASRAVAFFFFSTYMLGALLLLLNMLIAIIMDVYGEVKNRCNFHDPIWTEYWLLLDRMRMNLQGQRIPLPKMIDLFVKNCGGPDAWNSNECIFLADLTKSVEGLSDRQALRNLTAAVDFWATEHSVEPTTCEVMQAAKHSHAMLSSVHKHLLEIEHNQATNMDHLSAIRLSHGQDGQSASPRDGEATVPVLDISGLTAASKRSTDLERYLANNVSIESLMNAAELIAQERPGNVGFDGCEVNSILRLSSKCMESHVKQNALETKL